MHQSSPKHKLSRIVFDGLEKRPGDSELFNSGFSLDGEANMQKKNIAKRRKESKLQEPYLITKVNLDLERKLHEHTTKRQKQASAFGDSGLDVVTSFLDDLRSRRNLVSLNRRRNSPPLQSK